MRTKSTIINFITDAFPQVIILILGLIKVKLFLRVLGNEQLGLYQLYGQIVAYLVLLEGGVGSAMLFRLYKPIAEKDNEKISQTMCAGKVIFNVVGIIILLCGLGVSFFVNNFIKESSFTHAYVQITFILYLISQVLYYFTVPERVMFEAEQKKYIPNTVFQLIALLKAIVEIAIILLGRGLIEILISLIICSLIANGIIIIIYKKQHKYINKKAKKDFSMIKDVKDLFVNTLGNLISNNIDIIIISKFIGLGYVAIYSTYNYFVEAIKQFIEKITGATMAGIGNLMLEDKQRAYNVFEEFNNLVFYLATIICIPFYIIINSFINIWYEGKIITKEIYAILFSVILLYQVIRVPLKVYTLSSGKFKQVKNFVLLEIAINLLLSLILIRFMGITGVLLGTIISLIIADFLTKPRVIFKEIFDKNCNKYYAKALANFFIIMILAFAWRKIISYNISGIIECMLIGVIVAIINLAITTIYFKISKQFNFFSRIIRTIKGEKNEGVNNNSNI